MKVAIRQLPGGWQVGVKEARGKTFVPMFNGYLYTKAQASLAAANLERDIQRHGDVVFAPKKNPAKLAASVKKNPVRVTHHKKLAAYYPRGEFNVHKVTTGQKPGALLARFPDLTAAREYAQAWSDKHGKSLLIVGDK